MHLLVRAYLGYENRSAKRLDATVEATPDDEQGLGSLLQQSLGTAIPGPQAARDAATPEEAMAAFERHFFGEVRDVEQL